MEVVAAKSFGCDDTAPDLVLPPQPPQHLAVRLVQPVKRRPWALKEMERHGYQCLLYPLAAWPLVFSLAIFLTALSGVSALALPSVLADVRALGHWPVWVWLFGSLPFLIFAYASGFLDCALTSARAGVHRGIRWPGRNVASALKSGVRWLTCFLAGPVVPAGAGILFWIHGGDFVFWDWIMLAEIQILAITCWLLLVWAIHENDRLRDLPACVADFAHCLSPRLVGFAVGVSVFGLAHVWWAVAALQTIHDDILAGWSLLLLCWVSGMFFATFVFRWVGVWLYWHGVHAKEEGLLDEGSLLSAE
jgi:hypothetical protein